MTRLYAYLVLYLYYNTENHYISRHDSSKDDQKRQKWVMAQFLKTPTLFPKYKISLSLIQVWNDQAHKNYPTPYPGGVLILQEGLHSGFGKVHLPFNKPTFTLYWLAFDFLPLKAKDPHLAASSRDSLGPGAWLFSCSFSSCCREEPAVWCSLASREHIFWDIAPCGIKLRPEGSLELHLFLAYPPLISASHLSLPP